jgi:hypothetical protein
MNAIITKSPITIRSATPGDLSFIDSLQKMHSKQVGWMPTKTLEGKIKLGHAIVAEDAGERVGYCIGNDQYFKRDDVGIIYQMNVVPGKQRGLIGGSLLKAQFERSAWGCKLYCCWCAQDIAANKFWEAMGFVALAYRAGSESKSRVHIFWQKRIRAGDTTTAWWYPSKTNGGSIREDRLVLPIEPGTHWSDAKPLVLPGEPEVKALAGKKARVKKPVEKRNASPRNGMWFDVPAQGAPVAVEKAKREPKEKRKHDPRLVSAARELRDRWLEKVNSPGGERLLSGNGKYDASRMIGEGQQVRQITSSAA